MLTLIFWSIFQTFPTIEANGFRNYIFSTFMWSHFLLNINLSNGFGMIEIVYMFFLNECKWMNNYLLSLGIQTYKSRFVYTLFCINGEHCNNASLLLLFGTYFIANAGHWWQCIWKFYLVWISIECPKKYSFNYWQFKAITIFFGIWNN